MKLKIYNYLKLIFMFIFLCSLNYIINYNLQSKVFYDDDLATWHLYNNNNFIKFIFNTSFNKFRPILYILLWFCYKIGNNSMIFFNYVNLLISIIISLNIFYMINKITKIKYIAFTCSIAFILSKYAYYNITQVLGIMEALALLCACAFLYNCYQYLNNINKEKYYKNIIILYIVLPYIHERYIILLPMFFIILLLNNEISIKNLKWIKKLIIPIIIFIVFLGLRLVLFHDRFLDGTGGTDVKETFNIIKIIKFIRYQIFSLFQINIYRGFNYLHGISFNELNIIIKILICLWNLFIIFIVFKFIYEIIKNDKNRKNIIYNSILFISFICLCILSSSITIRVEMRWLYISYVGFLFYLAYMFYIIISKQTIEERKKLKYARLFLSIIIILLIPIELNYRKYYSNLYFWDNMLDRNALYEQTYEKYGDELFNKNLIIIDKNKEFTTDDMKYFFKQFNDNINFNIYVLNCYNKNLDTINKNDNIVLIRDKDNHKYNEY